MSFLDSGKIEAALIGFNTMFNAAFGLAPRMYEQMAMRVNSDRKIEQHNWMGPVPEFKEWTDSRPIQKLRNYNFQIVNKLWANGIEVDQTDLDDDRLDLYAPKIMALADAAARHYDRLLFDFLANGFDDTFGTCYDGQFFFDTDHKDGDGPTQSNHDTKKLSSTNYRAAYEAMLEIKNENGEPMDITPTHLVVGPKNRGTARDILLADRNANGATNTDKGTAELVVTPRLTGAHADKWFLLDLSRPIKPLVLQIRKPPQFRAVNRPEDEQAFLHNKLYFGADARHNVGYGAWHYAWGSDGTTGP